VQSITVQTGARTQFIDITARVASVVRQSGLSEGITINENADPSVRRDILAELDKVIPLRDGYTHAEGNSAAHIKSSLVGHSVTVPVVDGRLALGTWQGIYLCEFDGPRSRRVYVAIR